MRAESLLNELNNLVKEDSGHLDEVNLWLASLIWPFSRGSLLVRRYAGSGENPARDFWKEFSNKFRKLPKEYLNYLQRIVGAVYRAKSSEEDVLDVEYRTKTRLVIGLGASAWESGVQLLHPFGVPWVPGSSLKGRMEFVHSMKLVSRNPKLSGYLGFNRSPKVTYKELPRDRLPESLRELADLFGSKGRKGFLKVLGGFPSRIDGNRLFDVDVITPHYPSYYRSSGCSPPGDWDDPVPFFFPTVSRGVTFRFLLVFPEKYRKTVFSLLDETLRVHGVGGKTGSGYGLFERVEGV